MMHRWVRLFCALAVLMTAGAAVAVPPRMVFAHYMVCCTLDQSDATVDQLAAEIALARSYEIDGFALNIGAWDKEPIYKRITDHMFEAAKRFPGFKLFLSADNVSTDEATDMLRRYAADPAYLQVDGRPMLSTFGSKPAWDVDLRQKIAAAGLVMTFVPHEYPQVHGNPELPEPAALAAQYDASPRPDGYFYFGAAGPGQRIAAVSRSAAAAAKTAGLYYMAPVTPYYKGYGNNNRVFDNGGFAGMAAQWRAAIQGGANWIEIVTWNDFVESTYVRPFGDATPRPPGRWVALLAHDGFLNASLPYIRWYHTGRMPPIEADKVHVFYRPHASDDCGGSVRGGAPCISGYKALADRVYLVIEAKHPTRITVRSGDLQTVLNFPAGRSQGDAPLASGALSIEAFSSGKKRGWISPIGFGHDNRLLHQAMLGWSF